MIREIIVRPNEYFDSMVLMQANHAIAAMPGIHKAGIMMATEMNKRILGMIGFHDEATEAAMPGDLLVGLEAEDAESLKAALAALDEQLGRRKTAGRSRSKRFGSLAAAVRARPEATLAAISVPGAYAAREVHKALDAGLNCFVFSDNVPLDEEIEFKRKAREKNLLVMGPDCGTAIIDGAVLGFANAVPRGPVGVIGASGTGIQEFTVLLDRLGGLGISQAIGLGGRDLSREVGGMSASKALSLLRDDAGTECVVFLSKPPAPEVAAAVAREAEAVGKPVIFCLLEPAAASLETGGMVRVNSLEEAALRTLALCGRSPAVPLPSSDALRARGKDLAGRLSPGQKYMRGIFSGGSLCLEVMAHLVPVLGNCFSNIRMPGVLPLGSFRDCGHCFWDMGDDEFTQGRVHPMIDPGLVAESVLREAARPDVGCIVLDLVLGYGTHPDPSSVLGPAVAKAKQMAAEEGREVHVLAHVCGTDGDPQNASRQEERMRRAGALPCTTNLQLAKLAAAIVAEG